MPPAPGPSWRGSAQTPAQRGARSWRRPGTGSTASLPLKSRWLRGFLSLMSALVAIASIVLFIILIFVPGCSRTQFAILSPAPYTNGGLPPYPFAQQDREDYQTQLSAENLPDFLGKKQSTTAPKSEPRVRQAAKSVLVVYVAALAGRTDDGVVLYSIDSGPDEPEGYLPLQQLWDYLASLPSSQKKILAIDLSRGPIDWRWGQFTAPGLAPSTGQGPSQGDLDAILAKIPNLAVLTSAAPGEVSWPNPTFSHSVFAHFLLRGLAGEADGSGQATRDRRISLSELHNFVLTHTNHWVVQNRDLRGQHPQLFVAPAARPDPSGTVVAEVRGRPSPGISDSTRQVDGSRTKRLETLWEARDGWIAREPEQWDPLGWRQFLEHLHRAEQWRLVGQFEGMDPHLQAAETAERQLASRDASRKSETASSQFVATSLSRRTSLGPFAETTPVLPERQLQLVLQGLAPSTLAKPVQDASIRLRSRAEKQAWQPFRSRQWVGTVLAEADQVRRTSEDLLFVGSEAALVQSASSRQAAESKLELCEQITGDLTDAHRLHHRLLAELPDLAWWAAQRLPVENLRSTAIHSRRARLMKDYSLGIDEARFRPPSLEEQEKLRDESDDSALQQTEIDLLVMFEQTRQLGRLLDRELEPKFSYGTSSDWRDELKVLKQSLTHPEKGLDALRARLVRHAKGLIGADSEAAGASSNVELGQTQYFHWLRLRNALQWSGLPADLRRGLFLELEQSDRILNANAQKVPVAASAEWNGDEWGGVDGCWQALWALQSLSLGATDSGMHERWVVWKNAVVDSRTQTDLLAQLGRSVRVEFRDRVERSQPSPAATDRMDDVLRTLIVAERAARTLHGYDATLFASDRDPIRRLRDFDLAALSIAQANRYLQDFWGKVAPGDREPWYVQAVDQCLRVAQRQNDQVSVPALKTARTEVAQRMQELQAARLKLATKAETVDLSLASQQSVQLGVEIDDLIPPGIAALWLSDENPSSVLEFLPAERQAVTPTSTKSDVTIRKQRAVAAQNCGLIAVRPRLLFRGRFWDEQENVVQVDPCPPNSIDIVYQAPSATGEVVVFGVDRRDTILILDCSLSMAEPMVATNKQGDSRFQAARKALIEAIRVLRDGPVLRNEKEPNVVGLMAYGHRARTKNGDPNQTSTNPEWKLPIPSAVAEEWRNDFELLTPPDRLLDEQYRRIASNLDTLQPFGQTPLLGAIQSSARWLIDRKRGGVIVAITDGAYNDGIADGPRYKTLQQTLQSHPELSLHIVGFGVSAPAEIASLTKLGEHTRGTYHDAPDGTKLADAIEKVMKPRRFDVVREAQPREEYHSNLGQPVRDLAPHGYKVRFPDLAEFPIEIYGGERLEFDLDVANKSLKPRRPQPLLFRRAVDAGTFSLREPTRFGYLKADFDKATGRADFLFSLDRDDLLGIVERPAEIRIDITPRGAGARLSRSWRLSPSQSIPAWQVELRDWPADSKPLIQAWWKMARTEPDVLIPLADSIKGKSPAALPGWLDSSLSVTAEIQPGKVLLRLQAHQIPSGTSLGDLRVELGRRSQVQSRFIPAAFNWRNRLFEAQRQVTFEFDVGESFDASTADIAVTSQTSLERGCRTLETPLAIDKWDKEQ